MVRVGGIAAAFVRDRIGACRIATINLGTTADPILFADTFVDGAGIGGGSRQAAGIEDAQRVLPARGRVAPGVAIPRTIQEHAHAAVTGHGLDLFGGALQLLQLTGVRQFHLRQLSQVLDQIRDINHRHRHHQQTCRSR